MNHHHRIFQKSIQYYPISSWYYDGEEKCRQIGLLYRLLSYWRSTFFASHKSGSTTFTWHEKGSLKLTAYAIEMNRSRLLSSRYDGPNLWDDPFEDLRTLRIKAEWQTESNSVSRWIIRQILYAHPGNGRDIFWSVSGHVTKRNRCITKYTDRSEHEDRCIFIDVLIYSFVIC